LSVVVIVVFIEEVQCRMAVDGSGTICKTLLSCGLLVGDLVADLVVGDLNAYVQAPVLGLTKFGSNVWDQLGRLEVGIALNDTTNSEGFFREPSEGHRGGASRHVMEMEVEEALTREIIVSGVAAPLQCP